MEGGYSPCILLNTKFIEIVWRGGGVGQCYSAWYKKRSFSIIIP